MYSAFYVWAELLSLGSLNRASICARTAVNALVGVNYVLAVLLADSLNGAFLSASAASDAIISILYAIVTPPYVVVAILYHKFGKKEIGFAKKV